MYVYMIDQYLCITIYIIIIIYNNIYLLLLIYIIISMVFYLYLTSLDLQKQVYILKGNLKGRTHPPM